MAGKKDNSTGDRKIGLRINALMASGLADVPVLETHGGEGRIWRSCWSGLPGVVFEKDPRKVDILTQQRPTWAVYQGDCIKALRAGVASWVPFGILDLDPYGSPWEVCEAFFLTERELAGRMLVTVNDGLKQKLQINGGWDIKCDTVQWAVRRFGANAMYPRYLEIAQQMLAHVSSPAGYKVTAWTGYYTGAGRNMTHYAAILER